MIKENNGMKRQGLYLLSTGKPITSLSRYSTPLEEYQAAFARHETPFLKYYSCDRGKVVEIALSRGQFWELTQSAVSRLIRLGIEKGTRVVHCFSANSLYDLVFRLAAVLLGSVPVTINWQTDNIERIRYKADITSAKLLIYDSDFGRRLPSIRAELSGVALLPAEEIDRLEYPSGWTPPDISYEDEKIVVFTSGTTALPKGVSLSHRSYLANRLTFEAWLGMEDSDPLDLLLVNPLHHANSTALSDWGLRRPDTVIHLVKRYSTPYWQILLEVAEKKRGMLFAALVARHIEFLASLASTQRLPIKEAKLKDAMAKTDIMIGSAPVGPKTVKYVRNFSGHLPCVRFGSTETCLEVLATPVNMTDNRLQDAFEAGWSHCYCGEGLTGYYIGREHFPFTSLKVVRSIDPSANNYMQCCEVGEPGYLITKGPNVMNGYVGDSEATEAVFRDGWYIGLKDIAFTQINKDDGKTDYYWMSRDSELLIRGGVNYSYDQVAAELTRFVNDHFEIRPGSFHLAVVGIRLESEHDDSLCVTVELSEGKGHYEAMLNTGFLEMANRMVSKGSRPDYLRFAAIPRNFKGAILYPRLKQEFLNSLKENKVLRYNH